ncbi:hypothetical protein [Agriterribacter humi]|nr:hypothetical protein [Agriterribacter humi]
MKGKKIVSLTIQPFKRLNGSKNKSGIQVYRFSPKYYSLLLWGG